VECPQGEKGRGGKGRGKGARSEVPPPPLRASELTAMGHPGAAVRLVPGGCTRTHFSRTTRTPRAHQGYTTGTPRAHHGHTKGTPRAHQGHTTPSVGARPALLMPAAWILYQLLCFLPFSSCFPLWRCSGVTMRRSPPPLPQGPLGPPGRQAGSPCSSPGGSFSAEAAIVNFYHEGGYHP